MFRTKYDRYLVLSIPREKVVVKWSTVFEFFDLNSEDLNIEDYWVGQKTLEEIYFSCSDIKKPTKV